MVHARSVPRVWRERVRKYRLIGGRCPNCGKLVYPYRPACPYCGSEGLEEIRLAEKGRVLSYTVIRHPPSDFKGFEPYIVAIVELEGGVRVLAQLTDVEPREVEVGMEVEAVFRKYREQGPDGIIEYGVKFRPIRG